MRENTGEQCCCCLEWKGKLLISLVKGIKVLFCKDAFYHSHLEMPPCGVVKGYTTNHDFMKNPSFPTEVAESSMSASL